MVVFDATTLTLLLKPDASAPADPRTGKPVEKAGDRIDAYVDRLAKDRQRILIPTPVLSEVMVQSGSAGTSYLQRLQKLAVFEIGDFDVLAATELALMQNAALATGDKKLGESEAPWQKIKVDRQIVAIAKVKNAKVLFTDDGPLGRFAARMGMLVVRLHTLPLPVVENSNSPLDMFAQNAEDMRDNDEPDDNLGAELVEEELLGEPDAQPGHLDDDATDIDSQVSDVLTEIGAENEEHKSSTVVGDTLDEVMDNLVRQRGVVRLSRKSEVPGASTLMLSGPKNEKPDGE